MDTSGCIRGFHGPVGESALEVNTGRKNPLPHSGLESVSVLGLALQSDNPPTELSRPLGGSNCSTSITRIPNSLTALERVEYAYSLPVRV